MLKRILLGSVALGALASTALAADLPSRRAPAPYVAVPVFTWTGFYIGANAGYIFSDDSRIFTTGNDPFTIGNVASGARVAFTRDDPSGFTGGGQIGYNFQFGNVVAGVEADAAYTDFRRTVAVVGNTGAVSNFRTDMSFLGTVRGRIGYAFDRLMVYGTGGLAYADLDHRAVFNGIAFSPLVAYAGRRNGMETGWTAGGGVEYALPTSFNMFGSSAVTIKGEALYYDLGRTPVLVAATAIAPAGTSYTARFENTGVIARAGINFKFGTF